MKIWLIVTIFHHVAQVTGPLPMDFEHCTAEALNSALKADDKFKHGLVLPKLQGKDVKESDIAVFCYSSDTRPELDSEMM